LKKFIKNGTQRFTFSSLPHNMAAALHQPLPIALPALPDDPNVQLPAAPHFPPNVNDVLTAIKYRQNVDLSIGA
jgi:hypothetical protein